MGMVLTVRWTESSFPYSSFTILNALLHIFLTTAGMVSGSRSMYGAASSRRSWASFAKATSISTLPISSPGNGYQR
jgi:hypothetical protein